MPDNSMPVGTSAIVLLFFVFVSLIVGCGYGVLAIWPPDCVNNQCPPHTARLFFWSVTLERAENLLLLGKH